MFLNGSHCFFQLITIRPTAHAAIDFAMVHKKEHTQYVTLSMALN